ncbi:MAG: hypothetical protein A2566_03175 [Candidatus Zambryskibacteria bacterium RIFOXYD1_FULL_40_13]|nr:MAG: Peptidase M23 family protein [Parcubacteria group bacterium GW2011_GWC1_39_12]KKR19448.1 MAG: Peptidase M23 family protein [Parcubacteria group bacterium GW2011_GWF1_39_37]KKR35074.1 MAG: Peptidase M23 family protein [Parcubacteria group bacterium GW2011_GWC2_40_10]KKR52397.1 MAG: Peptidase M23 family protein [Parcubacteria group bacterium GW2011_GWE1_40_20]KKR65193.1 MAG: Peptidase M23 family protein [Parcubacteria group bacterium GW2011_GWB1_40_5]KKR69461.1 MAG: Peptidase M23 family 
MGSDKSAVNISRLLTNGVFSVIIFICLSVPVSAKAGVISFFTGFFSKAEAQTEEFELNSQNMALLQATISPNQSSTTAEEEITIVDGAFLLPEVQKFDDSKTVDEDQISLYVVRKGDTLPAIAKMFGVSVNTVRWSNDIKGSTISVGQTLVILPISGIQHKVKSGDTLQSITKLYKGDFEEVLMYNNLSKNSKLAIGDIIVVPGGEAIQVSSGGSSSTKKTTSYPTYEGYYMRPIVGGIRTQGLHDRYAVDLASSYGSNILASASGQVIVSKGSGWNGGYGSYIVIKHSNGTQTVYAHLSGVSVNVGDSVEQGQVIGKMGNTGRVKGLTGVHLHFEIRGARNPF